MTIGERVKKRRIEMGYTQEELAKRCGYKSRSSINKIELARDLPLKKAEQIAKVLDCEPSYLLGWDDTEPAELTGKTPEVLADLMFDATLLRYVKKILAMPQETKKALYQYIDFLSVKDKR